MNAVAKQMISDARLDLIANGREDYDGQDITVITSELISLRADRAALVAALEALLAATDKVPLDEIGDLADSFDQADAAARATLARVRG